VATDGEGTATTTPVSGGEGGSGKASGFTEARAKLRDWGGSPDKGEETASEPVDSPDAPEAEAEVQPEAEAEVADPPEEAEVEAEGAVGDEDPETEAAEASADEPEEEEEFGLKGEEKPKLDDSDDPEGAEDKSKVVRKPEGYAAEAEGGEWIPPEDLKIKYRADGEDLELSLDEVIQDAKKGRNYDRRSGELAQERRELQSNYREVIEQARGRIAQAEQNFHAQVKRFFEDPQYRDQALKEYRRLTENPEELEIRQKAQRADQLEKQIQERQAQDQKQWQQKVWSTVDSIIDEAKEHFPYADPNEVRKEFAQAYRRHGKRALTDRVVKTIIERNNERVATAVNSERSQLEEKLAEERRKREELEARLKANKENKRVEESVRRSKEAKVAEPTGEPPAGTAKKKPKSLSAARNALKEWGSTG
jgi:hypothetical protein